MPATEREIREAMLRARNGGDYVALFRGKKLGFKIAEAAKSCKEIKASVEDVVNSTKEDSVPPDSVTTTSPGGAAESGVVDKINDLARLLSAGVRSFGTTFITILKEKFLALVESFSKLKEALSEALKPLLMVMQQSLEWVIDLLFDVIPSAFMSFVSSLIAAILPFIGQIKAAGEMLVSIGKFVKGWIERNQLIRAARTLDPANKFAQEARTACEMMITMEVASSGADALLSTSNCAVSITGLVFTGNVASAIAGIASAVAKLCIQIASIAKDCWQMFKGNEELRYLESHPAKLDPARLFNASTLLGAYYIGSATQSSLLAFSELNDTKTGFFSKSWLARYKEEADKLSPFRAKAQQLARASRLVLSTNALSVVTDHDLEAAAVRPFISERDLKAAKARLRHAETKTIDPMTAIRNAHLAAGRIDYQIMSSTYITFAGLKNTSSAAGPVMLTVEQWKSHSSIVGFRTDLTKVTDKALDQYKRAIEPMLAKYAAGGQRSLKGLTAVIGDTNSRLSKLSETLEAAVQGWLTVKADSEKSKRAGFVRDLDRLVKRERDALMAFRAQLAPLHEKAIDLGIMQGF